MTMSTNGGNGISPVLLAIAEKLSSGGNGVVSPKSTELASSGTGMNTRPVFALKEGQTIIIVQNYHPEDRAEDGGSTGERSEGESGDLANTTSSADGLIWEQPGRPFRIMSGGLHTNGVTLLVQSSDVAMTSAAQGGSLSDQKHSGGESYEPCPICGDKVSGYHYGIFSCESCKGFFKRTVQNGKSFTCRHKGECSIAITNRKKCPACRFRKCRLAGMRLEAIRPDRTRGGRSNYEGCYTRTQPNSSERVVQPSPSSHSVPVKRSISGGGVPRPTSKAPLTHSSSSPSLACFNSVPKPDKPSSPSSSSSRLNSFTQVLEDLLAAESLVEDEENMEIENQVSLTSNDPFESLFRLIDHCLYKIVRWARNQRDFANIMTDDQIVLLQNCWAELLFINCCWKSLKVADGLHVGKDHIITTEMAKDMDIEKVTQRLLDYTDFLRSYQVDIYEIVALKMLLLLSPDVDNLSDPDGVKAYQEHMLDIFMTYTNEHYPHIPNKFGHLLAKQAELSRTCCLAKELLIPHERLGKVPDKSLLHELLKGDIALH